MDKPPPIPRKPASLLAQRERTHPATPPEVTRVLRTWRLHPPNLTVEHTSLFSSSSTSNLIHPTPYHESAKARTANTKQDINPSVSRLVDMGFPLDDATTAWSETLNFDSALDRLLAQNTSPPNTEPLNVRQRTAMLQKASESPNNGYISPKVPHHFSSQPQHERPFTWQPTQKTSPQQQPTRAPPPQQQQQYQGQRQNGTQPQRYPVANHIDDSSSDEDPEVELQQQKEWEKVRAERQREYIEKTRPKPDRSAHVSPTHDSYSSWKPLPKQPAPMDPLKEVTVHRLEGNALFKAGRYIEAEVAYSRAILATPAGHPILVVLYNNRGAARLKMESYQSCLDDCRFASQIIRFEKRPSGKHSVGSVQIEWSDQLFKALHRMAKSQEHLGKTQDALKTYTELQSLKPENTEVKEGIGRCQPKTSVRPGATTAFPNLDYSIFNPIPNPPPSKAVAEMRAREAKLEADTAEKVAKADMVNAQITAWRFGKEKNLRVLLVTLDSVVWPGANWVPVLLTDLLDTKQCKKVYLRAIAKIHPDKQPSTATVEQRLLASQIFQVLNEAWESFKIENQL